MQSSGGQTEIVSLISHEKNPESSRSRDHQEGASGSCQDLSDWLQMEEVSLCDPGSVHWGPPALLPHTCLSLLELLSDISSLTLHFPAVLPH